MSSTSGLSHQVLNAFRHHRKTHVIEVKGSYPNKDSAQRLSASSEDSRNQVQYETRVINVLNAFRHHRKTHWSTRRARHSLSNSAQRLSASSEDSLEHPQGASLIVEQCSTPFGIIGRLTGAPAGRVTHCRTVLNAFRHHRKPHWSTRRARHSLSNSAQRLSASSEDSPWLTMRGSAP